MKNLNLTLTYSAGRLPLWMDIPRSFYWGQPPLFIIDAFEVSQSVFYPVSFTRKHSLFGHLLKPKHKVIWQSDADIIFCHDFSYIHETFKYLHYIAMHSHTAKGDVQNARRNRFGCSECERVLQRSVHGTEQSFRAAGRVRGQRHAPRFGAAHCELSGWCVERILGSGQLGLAALAAG